MGAGWGAHFISRDDLRLSKLYSVLEAPYFLLLRETERGTQNPTELAQLTKVPSSAHTLLWL